MPASTIHSRYAGISGLVSQRRRCEDLARSTELPHSRLIDENGETAYLGNCMMRSSSSVFDSTSYVYRNDNLLIGWSGSLHNPADLRLQLNLHPHDQECSIVAAAYRKWGPLCFNTFVGEFCAAIWDEEENKLLLGRDAIGTRPLLFYKNSEIIIFASDARYILNNKKVDRTLDDVYIATYCIGVPDVTRTPFKEIAAVPPAHVSIISASGDVSLLRFWEPGGRNSTTYSSSSEYDAHFFHLFSSSIKARLNGYNTAVAELSGGLDSSSIVCTADRLIGHNEVTTTHLGTFSLVFDKATRSDERQYIAEVEKVRGTKSSTILFDSLRLMSDFRAAEWYDGPVVTRCFGKLHTMVANELKRCSTTVLLSGFGGDQVLWGGLTFPHDVSNALWNRQGMRAWKLIAQWSRVRPEPIPRIVWQALIVLIGIPRNGYHIPDWLSKKFSNRISLAGRMKQTQNQFCGSLEMPSQRAQARFLSDAVALISSNALAYHPAEGTIRPTFPFLDKRLIEYLISIPIERVVKVGESKTLLRRSLSHVLPEAILSRNTKGTSHFGIHLGLREVWQSSLCDLLVKPRCVERGYVDQTEYRRHLVAAKHGQALGGDMILTLLSLELWLRSLDSTS